MVVAAKRWIGRKGTEMTKRRSQKSSERARYYSLLLMCWLGLVFTNQGAMAQADQGAITGVGQDGSGAIVQRTPVRGRKVSTGLVLQGTATDRGGHGFYPLKIRTANG